MSSTWARPRTPPRDAGRRITTWMLVPLAALSALVFAAAAGAHVTAAPAFLASGGTESITLTAPNERDEPMTGFAVTAPPGLEIEYPHPAEGWSEEVDGASAVWTGGSGAAGRDASFRIELRAEADPGLDELQAEQRYPGGEVVRWTVPLTVTPAAETPSQHLALAGVLGLIGVLVIAAVVALARRRRRP